MEQFLHPESKSNGQWLWFFCASPLEKSRQQVVAFYYGALVRYCLHLPTPDRPGRHPVDPE